VGWCILMTNLLAPMLFDDIAEAERYAKKHTCALCMGTLVVHYAPDRKCKLCCRCGDFHEHQAITKYKAAQVEQDRLVATVELRPHNRSEFDPVENLKALGF
jgi:hypothetical protein